MNNDLNNQTNNIEQNNNQPAMDQNQMNNNPQPANFNNQPTMDQNQMNSNPQPANFNNNQPTMDQNGTKSNKNTIIIVAVAVVVIIVAVYFLFIKKDDNISNGGTGGSTGSGTVQEQIAYEKNVAVSEYGQFKDDDETQIILKVENKNKDDIQATVNMSFYNSEGTIVDTTDEYVYINGSGYSYVVLDTKSEFAKYEYTVKAEKSYIDVLADKDVEVTVTANEKDKMYLIQYKNKTNEIAVDYVGYLVMYKGDDIVDCEWLYEDKIRQDENRTSKEYFPYDSGYDTIKPDRYELLFSETRVSNN